MSTVGVDPGRSILGRVQRDVEKLWTASLKTTMSIS
jgi:hypothetical protein